NPARREPWQAAAKAGNRSEVQRKAAGVATLPLSRFRRLPVPDQGVGRLGPRIEGFEGELGAAIGSPPWSDRPLFPRTEQYRGLTGAGDWKEHRAMELLDWMV